MRISGFKVFRHEHCNEFYAKDRLCFLFLAIICEEKQTVEDIIVRLKTMLSCAAKLESQQEHVIAF